MKQFKAFFQRQTSRPENRATKAEDHRRDNSGKGGTRIRYIFSSLEKTKSLFRRQNVFQFIDALSGDKSSWVPTTHTQEINLKLKFGIGNK